MEKFIVQQGTENEFPIAYTLEGNLNSNNLVVMIHGGGMDHHEQGYYQVFDANGKVVKKMVDGKAKTVLTKQHIGNYDRIATELQTLENSPLIIRIDLRNHGESLLPGGLMDERDTLISRMAGDVVEVINHVMEEHNIENIHLFGTCLGGLVSECIATGLTNSKNTEYLNKIKSLFLNCPLSFQNLCTFDPNDKFNYEKTIAIINGPDGIQFRKMRGMFEGKETIKEAQRINDLPERVGNLHIPIHYVYGENDRLLPAAFSEQILNRMLSVNPQIEHVKLNMVNSHGYADHCLYSPQCSDQLLLEATKFYADILEKQRTL